MSLWPVIVQVEEQELLQPSEGPGRNLLDAIEGKVQNFEGNQRSEGIRWNQSQCIEWKVQLWQVPHASETLRFEGANLVVPQHEEAKV